VIIFAFGQSDLNFFVSNMKGLQESQKKMVETSLSVQCKLDTGLRDDVEWQLRNTHGEKLFT